MKSTPSEKPEPIAYACPPSGLQPGQTYHDDIVCHDIHRFVNSAFPKSAMERLRNHVADQVMQVVVERDALHKALVEIADVRTPSGIRHPSRQIARDVLGKFPCQ